MIIHRRCLERVREGILGPYDAVDGHAGGPSTVRPWTVWLMLWILPLFFTAIGLTQIILRNVDNQGAVCSSALPAATSIAHNPWGWITGGMWKGITPTPLYSSALALLFHWFGYDTRVAMNATCILSGIACFLLGLLTRRRFGMIAAGLAQVLYVTSPTVVMYSLSAGYYIWGLTPLLLSLVFLDRAEAKQSRRYLFVSAFALLLAGMSRPEIFALALPIAVLCPLPLLGRAGYLAITWSYPIGAAIISRIQGTSMPGAITARSFHSLTEAAQAWFREVGLVWTNGLGGYVITAIAAVGIAVFLWRRTRFLSMFILSYFGLFFVLHLLGRLEQNYAHYYLGPIVLSMIFAAGAITEMAGIGARLFQRMPFLSPGRALTLTLVLAAILCLNPIARMRACTRQASFQVDGDVRDIRNYLLAHSKPSDAIALDYVSEMTWMQAELFNTSGRSIWGYHVNNKPRPFFGVPTDEQSIRILNEYVRSGFEYFAGNCHPAWLVVVSDSAWQRVKNVKHYKINGLRYALGRESFYDGMNLDLAGNKIALTLAYSNGKFDVFSLKYLSL